MWWHAVLLLATTSQAVTNTTCDVLVLGAGLAGTSAAWRLVGERPSGTPQPRVCLVEASNRTGGRTKDHDIAGCDRPQTVELGAQWIAQKEVDADVWDLAVNVLGLGIYNGWPWALYGFPDGPAKRDPAVVERLSRVPAVSSAGFDAGRSFFGPNVSDADPQVGRCWRGVAAVYDSVVMGAPWETPGAAALDALTPLEWLDSMGCNLTKEDVVAQGLNQVDVSNPHELPPAFFLSVTSASSSGQEIFWLSSALWWLHAVKSNSGPISMAVDVQNYRIVGGPQQMSELLVRRLRRAGAIVVHDSPVTRVAYDEEGVRFFTAGGDVYRGRYAILTGTPVALSTHIAWEPPLPRGAEAMLRRARIGNYNKHYAFFDAGPTWREQPETWDALQRRAVQWPMVYAALPPLLPTSQQMPNGTAFFPSAIIDNSPPTLLAADEGDDEEGQGGGGGGCANGAGALFSFGWPQNGTTAAQRAEGWRTLLAGVPGLPPISSVVGQAWAEEPYVMGAYGAWWPPGVISAAGEQWAALPGGRVYFAGSEWSDVGAGYMNGAIHNGRKHGSLVARLLERERGGKVEL